MIATYIRAKNQISIFLHTQYKEKFHTHKYFMCLFECVTN